MLGVAAAARWGLSKPPVTPDVDVALADRKHAILDFTGRRTDVHETVSAIPAVTADDIDRTESQTALALTRFGLAEVREIGPDEPDTLVVWGDTPTDFALAMTWDRTYGNGVWIPNEWWQAETQQFVAAGLRMLRRPNVSNRVTFTSTSLSDEDIARRLQEWKDQAIRDPTDEEARALPATGLNFQRRMKIHLAVGRRYVTSLSTTVHEDPDGTLEFAMLPPVPDIGVVGLEKLEELGHWHVDVIVGNTEVPASVAVPDEDLLTEGRFRRL
jgi:hypothetical protein